MGSSSSALPPGKELPCLKIAIVGDPGVGKTSVLMRYLRNQFSPLYLPTRKVAIENVVRKVNVPAHTVVSLTFWDIPGQEDMDIHRSYFRNLDAAIVVVDMTNKATIEMANVWKQTVLNKLTRTDGTNNNDVPVSPVNFPVLLLGTKFDIVEEEIYQELANKNVSVSVNEDGEPVLEHPSIDHLNSMAETHNFIGGIAVSSKASDNSVSMAIQSLVRNIVEKKDVPRKWKPVVETGYKPPKKDRPFIYDNLEKTDIEKIFKMYRYSGLGRVEVEKYDKHIEDADSAVKENVVLRHYYTVSLARFKHQCVQGKLVKTEHDEPSLEDCILGLKQAAAEGSNFHVEQDKDDFHKLVVETETNGQKIKQTKQWRQAYRVFHNEYAAVAKAIIERGTMLMNNLEGHGLVMKKILDDHNKPPDGAGSKKQSKDEQLKSEQRHKEIEDTIVRNQAKINHALETISGALEQAMSDGAKIANVDRW